MIERRPYTYVLLRYRHDALSGEFGNVGVLLHEPRSGFLGLRARKTIGRRLSTMFPGISVEAFRNAVRVVERGVARLSNREASDMLSTLESAGTLAAKVLPKDDSSFVWGAVGSGLTLNAQATLDSLYERFVKRYEEKVRAARDDAAIWKPVRDRLLERNIADRLEAVVIHSSLDDVKFEHAWKNGAWHCYQPLSFDLLAGDSIRDKAARWAGQLLALEHASESFKAHFLVGAPANPDLRLDYERALGILKLAGDPEVIEEDQIETLVDSIEDGLRAHDAEVSLRRF